MSTKQMSIPGTRKKVHPDIEKQADKYTAVRDQRMALTPKETEEMELLLELMKKHKQKSYTLEDGRIVSVDVIEKAKVRRPKDGSDGGSDGEEEHDEGDEVESAVDTLASVGAPARAYDATGVGTISAGGEPLDSAQETIPLNQAMPRKKAKKGKGRRKAAAV